MKMTLDMPLVSSCQASECAYNINNTCNARAITIGDGLHPGCDTFFDNRTHTKKHHDSTGVGACKVTACKYNHEFECDAEAIVVNHGKNGVSCMTYELG